MPIQESGEMYLETLLILLEKKPSVRAIDIVEEMGFSKPAVSKALKNLREQALITTDDSGLIAFTPKGQSIAEKVYQKHVLLTDCFIRLGVDPDIAAADACKIEHVISDRTFEALVAHAGKP